METISTLFGLIQARFFGFGGGHHGGAVIVVHGGAGNGSEEQIAKKLMGVKRAALEGYDILRCGGSVTDAVETAVRFLEEDENFNAGYGSVLNEKGEVEMDASIMDGSNLKAGTVALVKSIAHPVSLARLVMDKTPHVKIIGDGAEKFAKDQCVPTVEPGSLISSHARELFEQSGKGGRDECSGNVDEPDCVGSVAMDCKGNVAAAASTGGTTGRMLGRCSASTTDSAVYADNKSGGVACSGDGESIIKMCLAHAICQEMEKGKKAEAAIKDEFAKVKLKLKSRGGATAISSNGEVAVHFTTPKMVWAYVKSGRMHYGVKPGEHETVCFDTSTN